MSPLPERPNLEHLRKQAKELLRHYRTGDPAALEQIRRHLPAAKDKSNADLSAMSLQLHDAQSCIARQYGFPSWHEMKHYVEWKKMLEQRFLFPLLRLGVLSATTVSCRL